MTACTSFVDTLRSTPRTISVPSSEATCRFLISSRDNACDDLSLLFPRAREGPRDSPSVAAALRLTLLGDRAILGPMPGNIGWQGALLIILVLLLVFGPQPSAFMPPEAFSTPSKVAFAGAVAVALRSLLRRLRTVLVPPFEETSQTVA